MGLAMVGAALGSCCTKALGCGFDLLTDFDGRLEELFGMVRAHSKQ
jgi:hypothetical protein